MGTSEVKRNSLGGEWGKGSCGHWPDPCSLAWGPQPKALPEVDGLLLSGGGAVSTACGLLGAGGLHTLGLPFLGAAGLDWGLRVSWRRGGGQTRDGPRHGCEAGGPDPPLPAQLLTFSGGLRRDHRVDAGRQAGEEIPEEE